MATLSGWFWSCMRVAKNVPARDATRGSKPVLDEIRVFLGVAAYHPFGSGTP